MTLLITVLAAVISTVVWYMNSDKGFKLDKLCLMYWGASLMWMCDAIFEFKELGSEYFTPALEDMINDTFLGLSAVVLGLVIWLVILLISDPKKVISRMTAKTADSLITK